MKLFGQTAADMPLVPPPLVKPTIAAIAIIWAEVIPSQLARCWEVATFQSTCLCSRITGKVHVAGELFRFAFTRNWQERGPGRHCGLHPFE